MNISVIGLGLIGGSMALSLRQNGFARFVAGYDSREEHAHTALALGLVNEIRDKQSIAENADLVVVAVPVDAAPSVVLQVLEHVHRHVVMDVGSTKEAITVAVRGHRNRGRFVATHPMWGTEHSGPDAAVATGFAGRTAVLCNRVESDADSAALVERVYAALGMPLVDMPAAEHDLHTAYTSHLPHIASFALANTVLQKEQREETLLALASAGFESTVRLAVSSPATWTPIFRQNSKCIAVALQEYIAQLQYVQQLLENNDDVAIGRFLHKANAIRNIVEQSRLRIVPETKNKA